MAIPDYQQIMLPLLKLTEDKQAHSLRQLTESLVHHFNLTESEKSELLPSGKQLKFSNRVGWAIFHLKRGFLIDSPKRGLFKITDRGIDVINQNLSEISIKFLESFPDFSISKIAENTNKPTSLNESELILRTPEELLDSSYQTLNQALADELIQTLKSCSPAFFEELVVDVLVKMGYGGTRQDAGRAIGKSGDGGIDGIIKEDRLGLDIIYLQAKRWEGTVGRPEIQKFAGALMGNSARKGVFITTSNFTNDASDYVKTIDRKIILIDGVALAKLMIDYNVGVTTIATYEIKKVDLDYFSEA